ncbi:MAG: peptide chain release factor-like protein [Candidatus Omnitrophica bacterium 4484_49]|nr:peptide chain release factor-like protein [Candidatus Omnitrophota bacterium]OQX82643.1 MAG: peptide chain release factor-like protein [Candidatus Omnitrophica bacterium 4484_49]
MDFGSVGIQKQRALLQKMQELEIKEEDIEEKFILSRGKGGQRRDRKATCVYLKHLPTGIEVKCDRERSQAINRFLARRMLVEKIEELKLGQEAEERKRLAKIRKQKRKRSKRTKEKLMRLKRIRKEKKQARAFKPDLTELECNE